MYTSTLLSSLQAISLLGLPLAAYANPHLLPRTPAAASTTINDDKPLVARDDPKPSAYPYGDAYPGEWQYLGWDKDVEEAIAARNCCVPQAERFQIQRGSG